MTTSRHLYINKMKFLKKDKWLMADSICVAQGSAVARNLMFESQREHQLFFQLWERYLGDMTEIIQYHLCPSSWTILFRTKTTIEIERAYIHQRKKSKKAKQENTLTDPSAMLSEHIRIFLSQFVRQSNRDLGRKGTKVLHRFKKGVINKALDYQSIFDLLTRQIKPLIQPKKKYRANTQDYDKCNEMPTDSVWKVGNTYYEKLMKKDEGWVDGVVRGIRLLKPSSSVLRKYLNPTIQITQIHQPPT